MQEFHNHVYMQVGRVPSVRETLLLEIFGSLYSVLVVIQKSSATISSFKVQIFP